MSNNWTFVNHRASISGSIYADEVLEPSNYAPRQSTASVRSRQTVTSAQAEGVNGENSGDSLQQFYRAQQWELNYREAAIYLEEGENNDKFTSHPENRAKLKYYFFAHSRWFNVVILVASVCIMLLALLEGPGEPVIEASSAVCGGLELLFLTVFALELAVRWALLGGANYVRHVRTMSKTLVVLALYVRAIGTLATPSGRLYWGVLRTFRPIFLLDCQYAGGTRRFVRQLLQTLPRIVLMLGMLTIVMFVFAIAGFYMFAGIDGYSQFATLPNSFLTVFVLITTSNFPNAMMPAYNESKWYAIYFITYLVISIYLVMNLLFSVVYDWFTLLESTKLRKLYMHRRAACQWAFRKLVRRREPTYIPLRNFEGLLRFYKPSMRHIDVYLTYKAMLIRSRNALRETNAHPRCSASCISSHAETNSIETDGTDDADFESRDETDERLTLDIFYDVYEATKLNWRTPRNGRIWHERLNSTGFRAAFTGLRIAVESVAFDWLVNAIVVANCAFVVAQTIDFTHLGTTELRNFDTLWVSIAFALVYAFEIVVKLMALGTLRFFSSAWNIYDFLIVLIIWLATGLEAVDDWLNGVDLLPFSLVLVLRPLRLVRILKAFDLYREIVSTLRVLAPRMLSALVVICVVYYSFGVIGNEVFADVELTNCCKNTTYADYYRMDNSSDEQGLYYLLTFKNAPSACVTLFHLTIVNDWYVTMNAYTIVTGTEWTRLYFAAFYLVTMVVLSMIVSFILDAFVFHMRCTRSTLDMNSSLMDQIEVTLTSAEREMCAAAQTTGAPLALVRTLQRSGDAHVSEEEHEHESPVRFVGERRRQPFEFNLQMHADEVRVWQHVAEVRRRNRLASRNSADRSSSSCWRQTINHLRSLCTTLQLQTATAFRVGERLDDARQPLEPPDADSISQLAVQRPAELTEHDAADEPPLGDPLRTLATLAPLSSAGSVCEAALSESDSVNVDRTLGGCIAMVDEDESLPEVLVGANARPSSSEAVAIRPRSAATSIAAAARPDKEEAAGSNSPPFFSTSLQQFTNIELNVKKTNKESAEAVENADADADSPHQ